MPSRASYLTGQYPSQLDIYSNGITLPETIDTLPEMLEPYGYHSANFGKLHFLPHANRDHRETHPDYGFDQLEISDEPGCYPDAYRSWVRKRAPDMLDQVSVGLPPAAESWPEDFGTDAITHPDHRFPKEPIPFPADEELTHSAFVADRTIEYLGSRTGDQPFFAVAGFYSPHSPWVVPQRFLDRYDPDEVQLPDFPADIEQRREDIPIKNDDSTEATFSDAELRRARHGYYAMITEVDHHVGRILDRLEELDMADNTIVVFTSDHGEDLGTHLRYGKGWPCEDTVSRVPLIVSYPGEIEAPGRTVSDLVEAVDLAPTLLEMAGIPLPPKLQGRSLRGNITDGEPLDRTAVLHESPHGKAIRTTDHRYLLPADGTEELYDLSTGPEQYENVAADHPEILARHRYLLANRLMDLNLASERDREWWY